MLRCIFIISLSCSVMTIKVPLSPIEDSTEIASTKIEDTLNNKPIYYESDESEVDSYLIPPSPHKHDEVPDAIATPSIYLLPPLPNSKSEYYIPTEPAVQTDWYPIVQALPKSNNKVFLNQLKTPEESVPIYISDRSQNPKQFKTKKVDDSTLLHIRVPSRQLLPPKHDFYISPATELELPAINTKQQFAVPATLTELQLPKLEKTQEFKPLNKIIPLRYNPAELALDLVPPPVVPIKYKNPTKLYPKKYSNSFKPIPIPISQFSEDNNDNLEVPVAKPVKPFTPSSSSEEEDYTLEDDKKTYLYEQAELKRQNNPQDESKQEEIDTDVSQKYSDEEAPEQDVSETGYRHSQPLREASQKKEEEATPPAPKDRTEFRMHGMKGPHSYQFGYDTGKGKNRQFRYEERDNDGHVKGHYGYVDRSGKLRVVNYDAHPEHGFHADAPQ